MLLLCPSFHVRSYTFKYAVLRAFVPAASGPLRLLPQGLCTCWLRVFACAYSHLDVLGLYTCLCLRLLETSVHWQVEASLTPLRTIISTPPPNSRLFYFSSQHRLLSNTEENFPYLFDLLARPSQRAQTTDKVFVFCSCFLASHR